MHHRLMGLALPFGKRAIGPVDGLLEEFGGGAATADALAFDYGVFSVDHQDRVPRAIVALFQGFAGIIASIQLPDTPQTRALMALRASWRGLSVELDRSTLKSAIDWPRATNRIREIGYISGLSLLVTRRPAYAETWVEPSSPAALARIRSENRAALARVYGTPNYRAMLPKSCWTQPRQSARMEALLANHDPDRQWLLRCGVIPERW